MKNLYSYTVMDEESEFTFNFPQKSTENIFKMAFVIGKTVYLKYLTELLKVHNQRYSRWIRVTYTEVLQDPVRTDITADKYFFVCVYFAFLINQFKVSDQGTLKIEGRTTHKFVYTRLLKFLLYSRTIQIDPCCSIQALYRWTRYFRQKWETTLKLPTILLKYIHLVVCTN